MLKPFSGPLSLTRRLNGLVDISKPTLYLMTVYLCEGPYRKSVKSQHAILHSHSDRKTAGKDPGCRSGAELGIEKARREQNGVVISLILAAVFAGDQRLITSDKQSVDRDCP